MNSRMIQASIALLLVVASAAASPLVAVDTRANPHPLVGFSSSSPSSITPLTTLAGSFIRGIDMHSAREGAYIATSSVADSPTGLFHLLDGVSTKIADLPFETTAVGGMSFNADESAIFVAIKNSDGTILYDVSFDGLFNMIGVVRVGDAGSTDIAGLAVDPKSGVLYGIDNQRDSLVTISTTDAQAIAVGDNGLGMSAIGGGGLDFSLDGATLFATTGAGRVVAVDPITGDAGPLLGTLPFGTDAMAAVPEPASLLLAAIPVVFRGRGRRS